jgi:glutathione-regulated potassium-efflux system ancillary protein KefG
MSNILILFAHPRFENSRAHAALLRQIPRSASVTFHDLYERYPDFNVDVAYEQQLLLAHEVIVWQHPFYWYSCPPLMKQWIDMVLEYGWAYGTNGNTLKGKLAFNALTSGGAREVYHREGRNRFTVREFLAPFDQTATLCHMQYLPPFAIQGTHRLSQEAIEQQAGQYGKLLRSIAEGSFHYPDMLKFEYLNDWLTEQK